MNIDINQNDHIIPQRKGSEVGKRSVGLAGSKDPADAGASAPSPNAGEGAEEDGGGWAMVTRRKAKASGIAVSVSPTAKTARIFASTSELERKRKAEQNLADQVTALREMVIQLVKGQEVQEARYKGQEVAFKRQTELLEELVKESQSQQRTITALQAIVDKRVAKSSYCDVARRGPQEETLTTQAKAKSGQAQTDLPLDHVQVNERTVSLDTGRTNAEKSDYKIVKQKLQQGLDKAKVTEGSKIQFLRPGPGERIEVIFEDRKQAEKARKHTGWATGQLPGTRVKGEEWYPVKCDMVAKLAVLDRTADDGRTLRQTLCEEFSKDNTADGIDFTAMKARWLSKIDVAKKVGSLVIWLKNRLAADHLLSTGVAIFGATGAYCSKWEKRDDGLPCFNCNKYGHKQAVCKAAPRCALCSGQHSRRSCTQPNKLKCPACDKEGHSVFDWQCQFHPSHWKYRGIQKTKRTGRESRPRASQTAGREQEVDMTDAGDHQVVDG